VPSDPRPDPQTETEVLLFNPRTQSWNEHLSGWREFTTSAESKAGRATIGRLKMNRPAIWWRASAGIEGGYHPPDV